MAHTHTDKLTDDGRRRLVRHGHLPEREIVTGIGAVAVRCPRVRDRVGEGGRRIRKNKMIVEQAVTNDVLDMGLLQQTAEPARQILDVETMSWPTKAILKARTSRLARRRD